MNSLQQLKQIRRLNQQRSANAARALTRLGREIEAQREKISICDTAMQDLTDAIARMRNEACPLLDRAAFFERKRREAALLSRRAELRVEHEQMQRELSDLHEQERALQQSIALLHSKAEKWQKAEGYFRRELSATQARIEERAIEGNVLCKQLIPVR